MGLTKTEEFTRTQNDLAALAKALGADADAVAGTQADALVAPTLAQPAESFDAFLRADTNERAGLLEKVTGTGLYRAVSTRVFERTEAARQAQAQNLDVSTFDLVAVVAGAFVNQRGLFRRQELADVFQKARIPSAQKWTATTAGQHIELGIAENNFFLLLASLGLAAPHFGTRLLPVGTVYDPFIARGLDALNYGCYQDARFLLVGTPSGITLAAEGGAHQSINTPLIGMGQPGLESFEPAFADEVALLMGWAFRHMQADDGSSVYLRLTTRQIEQQARAGDAWESGALAGAYWLREPAPGARAAIISAARKALSLLTLKAVL